LANDGTTIGLYGNAKPTDRHLASTIHTVDGEIFEWLKRRERRRRGRALGSLFTIAPTLIGKRIFYKDHTASIK
jgi:hypothetical protein